MKLHEIYEDAQTLEEGIIQRAIAAAALVVGSLGTNTADAPTISPEMRQKHAVAALEMRKGAEMQRLAQAAASRYRVDVEMVKEIVKSAHKHADPVFPTATDILSVIGVESSFNPNAVSKLKRDPARGLMQVRPGVWDLPDDALNTIDGQIKAGVDVLKQYYSKYKTREAALHAFNVGETMHRKAMRGKAPGNPRYVPKVEREREFYASNAKATTTPAGRDGVGVRNSKL